MLVKNPLTGDLRCPADYEAIYINSGTVTNQRHTPIIKKCGFLHLKKCADDVIESASADYEAYLCAAKTNISKSSGYMFGGLYSQNIDNVVTQTKECPLYFTPLTILGGLTICVSDDYEQGQQFNLPFAGLFSCAGGNPLAVDPSKSTKGNSPHSCPKGYSQHLAIIEDGCEVEYCIQSSAITVEHLPKIKLPPLTTRPLDIPMEEAKDDSSVTIFSPDSSSWSSLQEEVVKAASRNNTNTIEFAKQTVLNIPYVKSLIMANLSIENKLNLFNESSSSVSNKQLEIEKTSDETLQTAANENAAIGIKDISLAAHNVLGMEEPNTGDEAIKDYKQVSGVTIAVISVTGTLLAVLIVIGIVWVLKRKWSPASPYQKI